MPEITPFTFHWYIGVVPGFVGEAVNMTGVPAQILLAEAVIDTFAESPGFTVSVKSTVDPKQFPTFGVMWYFTIPGVAL